MNDYIVKATAFGGKVRAVAANTTNMVKESYLIHKTSPTASAALGRTLTAGALMSTFLKGDKNVLTIQIKGQGPIGSIVVTSDSKANVKGYVSNPSVDVFLNKTGKLDVGRVVGKKGYLNVIMDLGLKEPYVSLVDLVSGEIAEDLTYYYAYSEQIPSVVSLGVIVDSDCEPKVSGGFIIQLLSDGETEIIEQIETQITKIDSVSKMLEKEMTPEEILTIILGEENIKINGQYPCNLKCNCSRDRMERNLISLEKKEVVKIIEDGLGAELNCHFCGTNYKFEHQDIKKIHKLQNRE